MTSVFILESFKVPLDFLILIINRLFKNKGKTISIKWAPNWCNFVKKEKKNSLLYILGPGFQGIIIFCRMICILLK